MIDKQVIEKIVMEVLERNGFTGREAKPALLVVSSEEPEEKTLHALQRHWRTILCNPAVDELPSEVDRVVFLDVSQDLLVKSALGISDTEESTFFSKVMLAGARTSFILEQSLRWIPEKKGANDQVSPYVKMLLGHCDTLQKYGVSFHAEAENFMPEGDSISPTTTGKRGDFDEKLLTQSVLETWKDDEIHVSEQTIVTPLARDTARERNITIITKES